MRLSFRRYSFVSLILLFASCNLKLSGRPGRSESIEESKRREVYLNTYSAKEDLPVIDEIGEAWMEKSWRFTKYDYNDTQVSEHDGYQLCMKLDQKSSDNLFKTWSIKRDSTMLTYGVYGENTLVITFNAISNFDTLKFEIYSGDDKNRPDPRNFLGTLNLVKSEE